MNEEDEASLTDEEHPGVSTPPVNFTFGQKVAVFVPAALGACGIDALLHAPLPLAIGGVIGAYFLARNSPLMYATLKEHLCLPAPAPHAQQRGERSLLDRLLDRSPDEVHTQEYPEPSQEQAHPAHRARTQKPSPTSPTTRDWQERVVVREPSCDDLLDELPEPPTPEEIDHQDDDLQDLLPAPTSSRHGPFLFSSVLERLSPSLKRIYLATTPEGQDILCAAEDLCHVAVAGSTGGGKTSLERMLMGQLCKAGAHVLLLNPHYTRYDLGSGEDWTPFERYLLHDPMACRTYEVIEHYLRYAAKVLLPRRLEQRARSLPWGRPYFLVLDELPAIVRHLKKAPEYLRELIEEGRKVGIFLISAAHDFLIKTISPDSGGGSIRDCYRTAYYVGVMPPPRKPCWICHPTKFQRPS